MAIEVRSGAATTDSSTTSSAWVVDGPSSISNGDVVVIVVGMTDNTALGTPSGFTEILNNLWTAGNDGCTAAFYKVITDAGSEPATYTGSCNLVTSFGGYCCALSGVDTTGGVINGNESYNIRPNDTTPATADIVTTDTNQMVFATWAVCWTYSSMTAPGGSWTTQCIDTGGTDDGLNGVLAVCTYISATATTVTGPELGVSESGQETGAQIFAFIEAAGAPADLEINVADCSIIKTQLI